MQQSDVRCVMQVPAGTRLPTVRRWVTKVVFVFEKELKERISKETLARFARDTNPFSLKFPILCSFVPVESLGDDMLKHSACAKGSECQEASPRWLGKAAILILSPSCVLHAISWP